MPRAMTDTLCVWTWLYIDVAPDSAWEIAEELESSGAQAVTLHPCPGGGERYEPAPGETPLWSALQVRALFAGQGEARAAAAKMQSLGITPRLQECPDRDWVREGQAGFVPRRFGERLWIVPDWLDPPDDAAAPVFIAPGLAFGTGSHPTTALCLTWLAGADLAGAHVIDYGAGSGILALAAARLGAARVIAVDNDQQALQAVAANARRNGLTVETVAPERLSVSGVDVLLANILARPLVMLVEELTARVRLGGRLVLCGLDVRQADAVAAAYAGTARLDARAVRGDWVRLDLTRVG